VDVRLLLPERSDTRTLDYAAQATFEPLLRAGVRIFLHANVIHTKALLVDDDFVSLGSYNMDHRSLAYNLELVVNVLDPAYNQSVAEMFTDDLDTAAQVLLEAFMRRPLAARIFERLAYSLRHWL
jgi:cardiolipin synthase